MRTASHARTIPLLPALVSALAAVTLQAQSLDRSPRALSGDEHYRLLQRARDDARSGAHDRAAEGYAALTANAAFDARLWSEYAGVLERAGRHAGARRALQRFIGEAVVSPPPSIEYRIARTFALEGMRDSAFAWLDRALAHRYEVRPRIQTDSAFASLRDDPRFVRIAGAKPPKTLGRDEAWRYDLDYLVSEAQRLHVGFDRPAFSEAFLAAARSLRGRIPSLSDDRIMLEMRALLALLGDGHTNVFPRFSRLPVDFYHFADGLFVVRGSGAAEDLVGSRVLAFGKLTADEAMRAVARFVPRDNDMGVRFIGPALLGQPVVLQAIGAADDTAGVRLTVRDRAGRVRTVLVGSPTPVPALLRLAPPKDAPAPPPLYLQDTATFWLRPIPNTPAVYVQYNAVAHASGETTEQFAARLKRVLRETKATELVVDVRHNSGGNTFLYPPLLNAIIHFRESAPGNRVWVIVGRRTFSAAQNFATTLQRYVTDAIFVGEPTGSRPNFVGESPPVVLPYSGLRASISSRYHQNVDFTDLRKWIAPDVPTPLSSADYFANRDPALEAILRLIEKSRT